MATPEELSEWMKLNGRGYKAAGVQFHLTPAEVKELVSRAPTRTPTRAEKLKRRLKSVASDMNLCRSTNKVTALSALQGLAYRLETEITDLEEAATAERSRQGLTRSQRAIVDGVVAKLVQMPSSELEAILAGVSLRRNQKGIGESTQNRTP